MRFGTSNFLSNPSVLLLALVDEACRLAGHRVPIKIVLQRPGQIQAELNPANGDRNYADEMQRGLRFERCVQVASEDPLYTYDYPHSV